MRKKFEFGEPIELNITQRDIDRAVKAKMSSAMISTTCVIAQVARRNFGGVPSAGIGACRIYDKKGNLMMILDYSHDAWLMVKDFDDNRPIKPQKVHATVLKK
jgi:hypothetical protein